MGGATYSYDADGNLVTRVGGANGDASYTYDAEGRLIAAVTPDGIFTYDFDAAGNRVSMTKNGVRTDYLIDATGLGNVFAEYNSGGALSAHYAQGLGLASRVDAGGQAAFYHYDLTGNTQLLTGANGAVLNTYEYLPFGERIASTGALVNSFTFNGLFGVQENGAGLYDMRARVYDAALGRFLQQDPLGFVAGDTNLYRYTENSPVDRVDPSGLLFGLSTQIRQQQLPSIGSAVSAKLGALSSSTTSLSTPGGGFNLGSPVGAFGGLVSEISKNFGISSTFSDSARANLSGLPGLLDAVGQIQRNNQIGGGGIFGGLLKLEGAEGALASFASVVLRN